MKMDDFSKSQNYFRACRINVDIASEAIRELMKGKLNTAGYSLKDYLKLSKCKGFISPRNFYKDQLKILKSKDVSEDDLDISLLTLLLFNVFAMNTSEQQCLTNLRKTRNEVAHAVKCQFDNDDLFNRTKQHIFDLCKELSKEGSSKILENIRQIEGLQLLGTFSKLNIVRLHNGEMLLNLMDKEETGNYVDDRNYRF